MLTKRLKFAGNLVLALAVFAVGAVSIGSCLDRWNIIAYLAVSLRFQYLVVQAICVVALACLRNWPLMAVCLVLSVPNLIAVAPYFLPAAGRDGDKQGATLKICQVNVNCDNDEYGKVIDYIRRCNADVILIEELTDGWKKAIETGLPEYKNIVAFPRQDPFGIGTFSRLPMPKSAIRFYAGIGIPSVVAWIDWDGRTVKLIHVHPLPLPMYITENKAEIKDAAQEAAGEEGDVVVAGDFNGVVWNSAMQHLLSSARLRNCAYGFGWQAAWPRELKQWKHPETCINNRLLMIPIDHCMVSKNFVVRDYKAGESVGSDHSPICVELGMRR